MGDFSDYKLRRFRVEVLGCKVNQYDARQIEQLLNEYGLAPVGEGEEPDLVVIHTCGVTASAAQKSRQTIRRMQRENPLAAIAVTGCAATDELTSIEQDPVIRIPAGKDWLQSLAYEIEQLDVPKKGLAEGVDTDATPVAQFGDQTRAFLKIQDGCDIGCSFCIVPQLRKQPRDKPLEVAVREAELLVQNGYAEIVVTGVSVGLYGRDTGSSLAEVLRHIIQIPDVGRIRLSSLHPGELTDELLEVWASSPAIMPHLHLSLQSGSNAVLQAMRRGYSAEEYMDAVERARAALDNPAFTTDLIVGFPGETDAYFEESVAFCERVGFAQMHTFHYSPRPKTMAAKMKRQVNNQVVNERRERMRNVADAMSAAYYGQFHGRTLNVLVERSSDHFARGYSEHYIPVHFENAEPLTGRVVQVMPEVVTAEGIFGSVL